MVRDHRIETYDFNSGLIGANFDLYTWRSVNGILEAIWIQPNSFDPTGSLFLTISGQGYPVWSLISGTSTGNAASNTAYYPVASNVNQVNTTLSGTNGNGVYTDIPLFGTLRLVGSGLGAGTSGTSITVVYRMG